MCTKGLGGGHGNHFCTESKLKNCDIYSFITAMCLLHIKLHFLQFLKEEIHSTNDFTEIDSEKTVEKNDQNQEERKISE